MTVHRSEQVASDLNTVWLSGAVDYGMLHADRVIDRCEYIFGLLHDFPGIGTELEGFEPPIRFFPLQRYPYLVFYTIEPDGIRIVRVLHERRQAADHL